MRIFHDNTNINICTPSDSLSQRITFSKYYGGNVAKGGVFIQLCGWMGTIELYPGAISDSEYLIQTGILKEQKRFQEFDGKPKFINCLDRGYQITQAAWRNGQFVSQPIYSKGKRKFSSNETLKSSSISCDRSGNKRAVRAVKRAGFLHLERTSTDNEIQRLCDVWIAYGFMCNFTHLNVM